MGDAFLEYTDILQEVRGCMTPGRLKLQASNVIFKNIKTGKVDQYQTSEIDKVHWLIRARGFCVKVILNNGNIHRYDGFKESEFEKLSNFLKKNCDVELEKKDLSVKGWNWGTVNFIGNALEFDIGSHEAFEVPLANVSQSRTGKSEVTLEFHPNDDASVSLMEMRFHIPSDNVTDKDTVAEFHKNIMDKADIMQATGDALAIFEEIQCLTPRGRYDIKIFSSFIQLHGKTFDYKIPHTTVLRLFLLPHKDSRQMFFVVSLDPPIKQGQTRYPFLILLFQKEEEMTLELGLSEEDLDEKYEGKLAKEMTGPTYEIISRVMKAFINRKITVPGSFIGHSGTHAIVCSYKASSGYLYPLEKGFMFVHKPPVHIRFDEIGSVNFARSAGSTRSFDFDVETQAGTVYTFSSIEKDEYGKLYDFVTSKKLRVKNIGGSKNLGKGYADDLSDSGDEDTHDAYLERMKEEGKLRDEDDDDDDSSDESFAPDESASEVAEEYDSNVETTPTGESSSGDYSESDSDSKRERAQKKKEQKQKEREKKKRSKTVPEHRERKAGKKKKTKKDPDAPKRPQSAYFLWLNENREKIKEENPGISITELSKKAGELWREMRSGEKSKYDELALEAKEEYKKAMAEYKERKQEAGDLDGSDSDGSPKSKSKTKKKSPPKKSPKKESRAGAGSDYKSKEFISTSESSDISESDDDKPLKKKVKKEKAPSDEEMPSDSDSADEDSD